MRNDPDLIMSSTGRVHLPVQFRPWIKPSGIGLLLFLRLVLAITIYSKQYSCSCCLERPQPIPCNDDRFSILPVEPHRLSSNKGG
jgi:hypothetical protein